jgi:hypothetical protein
MQPIPFRQLIKKHRNDSWSVGEVKQENRFLHLVVEEASPEAGDGAVEGVGRQERRALERLVDILDDDERLRDGAAAVEKHGDLLMDRVVLQQQLALVAQVFEDQLVRHAFQAQGNLGAVAERAVESAHHLHHSFAHFSLRFPRLFWMD